MNCMCKQEHVFIGLDFGTTRSGAVATWACVCQQHSLFQVIKEVQVPKFPSIFVRSGNRIELVGPTVAVSDESAVRNATLEILLSDKDWFERTEDYNEIKSWVEEGWQGAGPAGYAAEHFGVAIKKLFELALAKLLKALENPDIGRQHITTVVTFPSLRDKFKESLKIGIMYSNIASRCQNLHVGEEAHAALRGLLYTYRKASEDALKKRESIIVADCGGITLDMTAFRESNPTCAGNPSYISKSVLGGGLWIDRKFEEMVDTKLDEVQSQTRHRNERLVSRIKSNLMAKWHRSIKAEPLEEMGTACSFELHGMQGSINRTDFEKILIPECQKIADAIFKIAELERSENGGRPANRVFLTGGLGCSQAVRDLVERILETKVAEDEPALVIEKTIDTDILWNAVALGAAHHFDQTIPVHHLSWQPLLGTPN